MTYLAIFGHKLYAPKGVGALVVRNDYSLQARDTTNKEVEQTALLLINTINKIHQLF